MDKIPGHISRLYDGDMMIPVVLMNSEFYMSWNMIYSIILIPPHTNVYTQMHKQKLEVEDICYVLLTLAM